MAFKYFDRVKEISTSTGTAAIALGGAVSQFQSFQSVFSTGDNMYYCLADQNGTNWEVGVGVLTAATTLNRLTVLSSSNANALVNFASAALYVFNTYAATQFVSVNIPVGSAIALSTAASTNVTSLALAAGDWEVSGSVAFTANSLTTATVFQGGISGVANTLPTAPGAGALTVIGLSLSAGGVDPVLPVGGTRIVAAVATTAYLVAQSTFAVNAMSAYGYLQAWRR